MAQEGTLTVEEVTSVSDLDGLCAVLGNLGYAFKRQQDSVAIEVGQKDSSIVCVVMFTKGGTRLRFVCELAKLGDIVEDDCPAFMYACLKATSELDPIAVDFVAPGEDDTTVESFAQTRITLVDSISVGDISETEVRNELQSVLTAVSTFGPLLEEYLKKD